MLIVANTIYGLLITPFILNYVGDSAYGVYKSVASISASLAVMDLGLGTTMTRYMARYNATKDKENAEKLAAIRQARREKQEKFEKMQAQREAMRLQKARETKKEEEVAQNNGL